MARTLRRSEEMRQLVKILLSWIETRAVLLALVVVALVATFDLSRIPVVKTVWGYFYTSGYQVLVDEHGSVGAEAILYNQLSSNNQNTKDVEDVDCCKEVENHCSRLWGIYRAMITIVGEKGSEAVICVDPITDELIIEKEFQDIGKEHQAVLKTLANSNCGSLLSHKMRVSSAWALADITHWQFTRKAACFRHVKLDASAGHPLNTDNEYRWLIWPQRDLR